MKYHCSASFGYNHNKVKITTVKEDHYSSHFPDSEIFRVIKGLTTSHTSWLQQEKMYVIKSYVVATYMYSRKKETSFLSKMLVQRLPLHQMIIFQPLFVQYQCYYPRKFFTVYIRKMHAASMIFCVMQIVNCML